MHNAASALLDKCCPALRAADLDLSLSSRDADLLLTARACINMVYSSLFPDIFLLLEESTDLICLCQERLILCIAL